VAAVNPGTTGLVHWWSLDETSGSRLDSHGSNHLTPVGSLSYAAGKVGNAADFEVGTTDYLTLGSAVSIAGAWSVSFWCKPESFISGRYAFFFSHSSLTGGTYYVYHDNSNQWYEVPNAVGTQTLSTGTWYHITIVNSGSGTYTVYQNGAAYSTSAASGTLKINQLGRFITSSTNLFDGLMDEFSVWSVALSADNVEYLYNSGAGIAYSGLNTQSIVPHLAAHTDWWSR